MEPGSMVELEVSERRDGYLKAERGGDRFSIAGNGSVGETVAARVVREQDNVFIAITDGALLRLRIDAVVDESTVRANPAYGPVFISAALSLGEWWQCVVTGIRDDRVIAKPRKKIPRRSSIPQGPPPTDQTQSLNHLLNHR